ncbi:uncharacterized protein LOC115876123 [Sitophilus oryzae]|uniref:Uncharacterized protein LOC115876123 n=1 Tax=Sitophilus oryzae TaxID=7048 RepID=A0A6J2X8W1_SITOR|nr:uncharacterized protein LOC115876123 [Sitophilus oryzae]
MAIQDQDRTILTDHTVNHNRPDILLIDKVKKNVIILDVAIPNNNNLGSKHCEKIAKYRDLQEQIKKQWKIETIKTIPIIVSTTGLIPKQLKKNISELGLNENLYKSMQKATSLATARTTRKYLGNPSKPQEPYNIERVPTELNPSNLI